MNNSFKPANYNSVSPYLVVKGAHKLIELLKTVFNAEELRRYDSPDGSIVHAEVRVDDSVIMIADSNDQYPPQASLVHIYVPDSKSTFRKAIDAGCTPVQEPERKGDDPDLRGMFTDFAGNLWAVGTQQ